MEKEILKKNGDKKPKTVKKPAPKIDRRAVLKEQIDANAKRPVGRPTILTDDFKNAFLYYITCGLTVNKALAQIASDKQKSETDDGYFPYIHHDVIIPIRATIFYWLAKDSEFSDQYAHAKEAGIEAWVDETVDIADDPSLDKIEKLDKDGNPTGEMRTDTEAIQRSKLRVETRQFYIERLKPKRYGTLIKNQLDVDPDSPLGKSLFSQLSPVPVRAQKEADNAE